MVARPGVEPTNLRLKAIDSTNAPSRATQVQTSNTYAELIGRANSISSDLMHFAFCTPRSLHSPLGCNGLSGCSPHALCYCSIQELRLQRCSVRALQITIGCYF